MVFILLLRWQLHMEKMFGIDDNSLLLALLLTQVVAFPFSLIFGKLAKKFPVKSLILSCIIGYFFIAVFALWLDTAWKFWVLAVFVAVFKAQFKHYRDHIMLKSFQKVRRVNILEFLIYIW